MQKHDDLTMDQDDQGPTPNDKRPKIPPPGPSRLMVNRGAVGTFWMVFDMENPMNMDDDWGYPYFRKPPYHSTAPQ